MAGFDSQLAVGEFEVTRAVLENSRAPIEVVQRIDGILHGFLEELRGCGNPRAYLVRESAGLAAAISVDGKYEHIGAAVNADLGALDCELSRVGSPKGIFAVDERVRANIESRRPSGTDHAAAAQHFDALLEVWGKVKPWTSPVALLNTTNLRPVTVRALRFGPIMRALGADAGERAIRGFADSAYYQGPAAEAVASFFPNMESAPRGQLWSVGKTQDIVSALALLRHEGLL